MRFKPDIFMNDHQMGCRFRILVLGKVSADAMVRLGFKLTSTIPQRQSGKSSLINAVFNVDMAVGAFLFESSFAY